MIERLLLVEATHMHKPLKRLARSSKVKSIVSPSYRHDIEIDRGCVCTIDRDFRLAGALSPGDGGKVHERELHGPLHFVGVVAGKENDRTVGVDADWRGLYPVRFRIA